jgi:redox-sensitive bicupin YhaK (pirin superfamily)
MLDGHMLHEDHLGNRGDLVAGGVQWMTAGAASCTRRCRSRRKGRMRGFQLWINLPGREKMKPAAYRGIPSEAIPRVMLAGGVEVKVIAGALTVGAQTIAGPIQGISTEPLFLDVRLPAGTSFAQPLPAGHNAFLYPYEGRLGVGASDERRALAAHEAGILSPAEVV